MEEFENIPAKKKVKTKKELTVHKQKSLFKMFWNFFQRVSALLMAQKKTDDSSSSQYQEAQAQIFKT